MTYQELLEGITRHRANPVGPFTFGGHPADGLNQELLRKFNEIEWALQALAEKLAEGENVK